MSLFTTIVGVVIALLWTTHHLVSKGPSMSTPVMLRNSTNVTQNDLPVTDIRCLDATINIPDYKKAVEMLGRYCVDFNIGFQSPYVAVVGHTIAYVCSVVGPDYCSGLELEVVGMLLDKICGAAVAGFVRLKEDNATIYGRGVFGTDMCRKLGYGRMRNYRFRPLPGWINGTWVCGNQNSTTGGGVQAVLGYV